MSISSNTSWSPRISVVTICFNQREFVRAAIESVRSQNYPDVEHIVVDPGSTDGSRDVILTCRDSLAHVIFQPDKGPADGLNRGFERATGEIFCYLNADDLFLPGAFHNVIEAFVRLPRADLIIGHSMIIDAAGAKIREAYSDCVSRRALAFGACTILQPSSFFRSTGRILWPSFNVANRTNWDGEHFEDLLLRGARFCTVDAFYSAYRIHSRSITGSGSLATKIKAYERARFERLLHRPERRSDVMLKAYYMLLKYGRTPRALYQRLAHGPVFGGARG